MPVLRPSTQPQLPNNSKTRSSPVRRIAKSWRYRRSRPYPLLMVPYYLFHFFLWLAPSTFREEVGRELLDDFTVALDDTYEQGGILALLPFAGANVWAMFCVSITMRIAPMVVAMKSFTFPIAQCLAAPWFIGAQVMRWFGTRLWSKGYDGMTQVAMPILACIRKVVNFVRSRFMGPGYIYYRRGSSSFRLAISSSVVDIRLRVSFRIIGVLLNIILLVACGMVVVAKR
jgi:hypothetical protein